MGGDLITSSSEENCEGRGSNTACMHAACKPNFSQLRSRVSVGVRIISLTARPSADRRPIVGPWSAVASSLHHGSGRTPDRSDPGAAAAGLARRLRCARQVSDRGAAAYVGRVPGGVRGGRAARRGNWRGSGRVFILHRRPPRWREDIGGRPDPHTAHSPMLHLPSVHC